MITFNEALKKIHAKIEDGELLIKKEDKFQPINLTKFTYHDYYRTHFIMNNRVDDINFIKNVVNNTLTDYQKKSFNKQVTKNRLFSSAMIYKAEIETGLKYGDYVEFKHYDEIVKGYIEEPRLSEDIIVSNIERGQFSAMNSYVNYIVKSVDLKDIKESLITHVKSELCDEVMIDIETLNIFLKLTK